MYLPRDYNLRFLLIKIVSISILSVNICVAKTLGSLPQQSKYEQIDKNLENISSNITSQNDSLKNTITETLKLSEKVNYQAGIERSYFYLARYLSLNNQIDSSIFYYKKGLEITKRLDKSNLLGSYFVNLGIIYWNTSDYSSGLETALEAKEYFENKGTLNEMYELFNLLGLCYDGLLESQQAILHLSQAAEIALEKNQEGFAGVVYANIGKVFFRNEQIDSALFYYKKGVSLEEKNKLLTNAGRSYTSIAQIYINENKMDSAKYYLNKALDYNIAMYDNIGMVRTKTAFGKYFSLLKNYTESNNCLLQIIPQAQQNKTYNELIEIYHILMHNYKIMGSYKESSLYAEKYIELYQKVYDFKRINSVKSLEHKLKITQQQNEINLLSIEKQQSLNTYLIIIVGLLLIISALAILFVVYFRRNNKILKNQNQKILEQKEILEKLNGQLILAEQNISKVDEIKSNFINILSHEIRTPLNGIVGFSSIMVDSEISNLEKIEASNIIRKSSDDLISTIEGLVDLSLIKSKQLFVYNQVFELFDFVDRLNIEFNNIRSTLSKDTIPLHIIKDDRFKEYYLNSDSHLLKKCLVKIMHNALKFTQKGKIEFGLSIENNHVQFIVSDTGIGIPDDFKDNVFEQFQKPVIFRRIRVD